MSPVKVIPSLPMMETEVSPLMFVDRSGVVYIAITAANDCFDEAVVFLCSGKRDSVQVDCSRRAALNRCSGSGIA